MRVAVIVNRSAGSIAPDQGDEELREKFRAVGVDADVKLVPGEEIVATAKKAAAGGVDAVVAGGGDGTIRAVASALSGSEVPLGVLPLGTLNHFAKDLGIPTDLDGAVELIPKGEIRALDLGEVNGEVFINNSVLGFYPPVVQLRDWQRRKHNRNKWVAAVIAMFKVLPHVHSLRLRMEADGLEMHRETRFVFIGNNEYQMNAFNFGARSRLDSGCLYLYIARPRTRAGLAGLALLSLVKDVTQTEHFDCFNLPAFDVDTRRKALPVFLDGEVTMMNPPLQYRVQPRALRVILPPQAPG